MIRAVADTHTLVWYLYNDPRLSSTARTLIENAATSGDQVALSSISLVEILYLIEKERIAPEVMPRLMAELDAPHSPLIEIPVDRTCIESLRRVPRTDVPDLPDRIISATALQLDVPVLSRDYKIQTSAIHTVW
jgi:PIN domain nuclease of toxin-antitoxin system